jgi:hypothetical protein
MSAGDAAAFAVNCKTLGRTFHKAQLTGSFVMCVSGSVIRKSTYVAELIQRTTTTTMTMMMIACKTHTLNTVRAQTITNAGNLLYIK